MKNLLPLFIYKNMIYINNLSISNDKNTLSVDVETNVNSNITQVLLWNENTFKDYSKAIDISFKLEGINNREIFILEDTEINIDGFEGIYFLEFTSNYEEEGCTNCENTVIGIAANLNNIKNYLLDEVLNLEVCNTCPNNFDNIINIQLTLKSISLALSLGFYEEAIFLYKKIKQLLGSKLNCTNCRTLKNPVYINGLNFSILNNTIILV